MKNKDMKLGDLGFAPEIPRFARNDKGRNGQRGQTLVIALIVLFVLLLIGFVFLGILNRNLVQTSTSQQRSLAADLADAGIRYAQEQLLNSPDGADWKPVATPPIDVQDSSGNVYPTLQALLTADASYNGPLYTNDPDMYWLRPAPLIKGSFTTQGVNATTAVKLRPGDALPDKGGPDGLGPFSRIMAKQGRILIRVRYAPSDVDVTASSTPYGPLRHPGVLHNYIIIESVGRPGVLNANDPTSIPSFSISEFPSFEQYIQDLNFKTGDTTHPQGVAYQWLNSGQYPSAIALWTNLDNQFVHSRKLMAFASIGIIDDALYVTNPYHSSNPIPIGIPDLGLSEIDDVGSQPSVNVAPSFTLGKSNEYNMGTMTTPWPGGGGMYINGNALFFGTVQDTLNRDLGEAIDVAGTATGQGGLNSGDLSASLVLNTFSSGAVQPQVTISDPNSSPSFDTYQGAYRDGEAGTDANGDPRDVPYKPAPDILRIDPDTGTNRYLTLTRDSGVFNTAGNTGQYGHGRGVYVNNGGGDLQVQNDENDRIAAGGTEALFNDWLHPNNGLPGSSWVGPYYIPPGAFLQLLPDGFIITLDSKGTYKTWRFPDGTDTGSPTLRFRIAPPSSPYAGNIVNSATPGVTISDPTPDFSKGTPFNGVLYFEGNVRVRGVIPTYFPLTVVSMGNIYVEGSIVKGVTDANGNVISGQTPQTAIALLARDYVVVNTTQFFGPSTGSPPPVEKNSSPGIPSPVVVPAANGELDLWTEFLLDPDHLTTGSGANLTTPQNWPWFSGEYATPGATPTAIDTRMLLQHTSDDGPAPDAYVSLGINQMFAPITSVGADAYQFPQPGGAPNNPVYTLGQEDYQRYSKFESMSFPVLDPTNIATSSPPQVPIGFGSYTISTELPTFFGFHPNATPPPTGANDYLLSRSAITPSDIRIEAVMFAEEGSFFVIPGDWFNTNPEDVRAAGDTTSAAVEERLQNFGNDSYVPFYQEPLDVKITILGSINENMPAPMSQQVEWDRKWAWIPRMHGNSGESIPSVHNDPQDGYDVTNGALYVPNLSLVYDPMLATGRVNGFQPTAQTLGNPAVRLDPNDPTQLSMLPPLPCLPVSPTLIYFGEVSP